MPNYLKSLFRFLYYKNERKKVKREIVIRKAQNKQIKNQYYKQIDRLIIFIVDGANWFTGYDNISGGILSIASIYAETEKLKQIHGAEVIMVTHPSAHLLLQHTQFPSEITVFRFSQLRYFSKLDNVLVHIPEFLFQPELIHEITKSFDYLIPETIHLNILNQRIDIMPSPSIIQEAKQAGFTITQTTAHEQYSTPEIRNKFGIPLHKLSVYATPERYNFKAPNEKENLILISPDVVEQKQEILNHIKACLPNFTIQIIKDITYMEYLTLIEKAKYMITFGEGLDFYYIETAFSGGVTFAVYNEAFFTKDFKYVSGIHNSYLEMKAEIVETIKKLENDSATYKAFNKDQFNTCHKIYNSKYYKENLINFYKHNYLFP